MVEARELRHGDRIVVGEHVVTVIRRPVRSGEDLIVRYRVVGSRRGFVKCTPLRKFRKA